MQCNERDNKKFYKHLRVKPKKIIKFHYGVSEGQFQQLTALLSFARNFQFFRLSLRNRLL